MVGDSLGLVLVIPVNKDDRRAGEMDQIAFEIDVFHSGLRGLFPFGHATSDRLFLSFFFERIRQAGAGTLFRDVFAGIDQMPKWNEGRKSQNWVGERSNY